MNNRNFLSRCSKFVPPVIVHDLLLFVLLGVLLVLLLESILPGVLTQIVPLAVFLFALIGISIVWWKNASQLHWVSTPLRSPLLMVLSIILLFVLIYNASLHYPLWIVLLIFLLYLGIFSVFSSLFNDSK